MKKMAKINITNKDLPIVSMTSLVELLLISIQKILEKKEKYTTKWREIGKAFDFIIDHHKPIYDHLNNCFLKSVSLRENELNETKYQIAQIIIILENLDDVEVADKLTEISDLIEEKINVRVAKDQKVR